MVIPKSALAINSSTSGLLQLPDVKDLLKASILAFALSNSLLPHLIY